MREIEQRGGPSPPEGEASPSSSEVGPRPCGRLLLGDDGEVHLAEEIVYQALGLPGAEAGEEELVERLEALGLLPSPEDPAASFHRITVTGHWDDVVEIAFCRLPEGGWAGIVHFLRDSDVKRGGFQSLAGFLATSAHELQTPLTSLKASLQLIDRWREDFPPKVVQLLDVAHRGVERLVRIVGDIVDVMRLQSDTMELALKPEELTSLVQEVEERFVLRHPDRDLEVEIDPSAPSVLYADRGRLAQVLLELLENAAKCSPPGTPLRLGVASTGEAAVLTVIDEGEGIPSHHREAVFQPFFQVDASATRPVPGLGLGLALSKGIIERHGGRIRIEEAQGGGGAVVVEIPADPQDTATGDEGGQHD